jgi:hypothetical protein
MAQASCKAAFPSLDADVRALGEAHGVKPIQATVLRPAIDLETLRSLWERRNIGSLKGIDRFLPKILTEWSRGDSTTYDLLSREP